MDTRVRGKGSGETGRIEEVKLPEWLAYQQKRLRLCFGDQDQKIAGLFFLLKAQRRALQDRPLTTLAHIQADQLWEGVE